MKKLFLLCAALSVAGLANAQPLRLVNNDGSVYSELCIAAAQSQREFSALVADTDVASMPKSELRCNGMNVDQFVRKLRHQQEQVKVKAGATPAYVFSVADESDLSKLCLAAVRSEQEYQNLRAELFGDNQEVEREILCNGRPIRAFARKYRSARNMTASIR